MTATDLYKAGYQDLVSVVPPGAKLAPNTTLKREARGKVPGRRRIDGTWVGYPWLNEDPPTPADVAQWESWGANIGLRADYFPGLDVDVENRQLAQLVVQEAHKQLGSSLVRTSREPRKLLVYRTEEPFSRIAATIAYQGEKHEVEALSEGRQYLVYGKHPSGSNYGWTGKPLSKVHPDSLSTITAEDVREFFVHLAEKLQGRADVTIQGTGEAKDKTAPPQDQLQAPSLTALASVIECIPNDYPDRDDYIRIGHAIKAAGGEEAFPVFQEWCNRWEGGTNETETVQADWARMHPPFRVGWSFLQDLAAERGDYDPVTDAFEADPKGQSSTGERAHSHGLMAYTDTWIVEQVAGKISDRVRYVPETARYHVWGEE